MTELEHGSPEQRIADLEWGMQAMIWLHTEKAQQLERLALAVAGLLAQQIQPHLQEVIKQQLTGQQPDGQPQSNGGWLSQISPDTRLPDGVENI